MPRSGWFAARVLTGAMTLLVCGVQHAAAADWTAIPPRDNRGTVLIRVNWADQGKLHSGSGTGFVIDRQGHIVTVAHLIPSSPTATVLLSGETEAWASEYQRQMFPLEIDHIDRDADVAVLVAAAPVTLTPVPLAWDWRPVESAEVHVRGFPLGGLLEGMPGTVRRGEVSREVPITTLLREGFSGSPVYGVGGQVVGMARGGTPVADVKDSRVMGLGFFVPLLLLRNELPPPLVRSAGEAWEGSKPPRPNPAIEVRLSYSTSEVKETEYTGFLDLFKPSETKVYSTGRIAAQPGHQIVRHEYLEHSANGLSGREVAVAPDGSWIEMTFSLTSGPGYNRTRGWLDATIVTVQRLRR